MPNHISNKLTFKGSESRVNEVREFIKGKEKCIDFNTIIPMPRELNIESSSRMKGSREYQRNIEQYGFPTWYEWSIANWGTKWNAYDQEEDDLYCITFNTAWSGVPEIILKLSGLFPDVTINYVFADEDSGYNTGKGYFKDGKMYMDFQTGGSDEAMNNYFETHPESVDRYKKIDGEWKYVDDDE